MEEDELEKKSLAIFDFDNTLTTKDMLLPFLSSYTGKLRLFWILFTLLPKLIQAAFGFISRQQMKETLLTKVFSGEKESTLQNLGKNFATHKVPSYFHPKALKRLSWHQEKGHLCILISANLDLLIKPCGELLNFNQVICSLCAVDSSGTLTGKLKGKNCWGEEKKRRLEEFLGPLKKYTIYAYGDSRGDYELLSLADFAFYRSF